MKFSVNDTCPCGSQKKYKKCCKPFHDNTTLPKTALELMKSRYCAFAVGKSEYIISTTHKDNVDFKSDIKSWNEDILDFCKNTKFEKLEILEFIDEQTQSFVTFKVTLFQDGNDVSFCEKSRFLKIDEKWLYVNGQFMN